MTPRVAGGGMRIQYSGGNKCEQKSKQLTLNYKFVKKESNTFKTYCPLRSSVGAPRSDQQTDPQRRWKRSDTAYYLYFTKQKCEQEKSAKRTLQNTMVQIDFIKLKT